MVKSYAEMKKSEVRWLWQDRIPLGALTVLDGDPGQFKSQITIDLASRVTTGAKMPCGSDGVVPGSVLLINFEDDPSRVIYPRLDSAGANMSRVFDMRDEVPEDVVQFPRDIPRVERLIVEQEIRLIVIDPLSAAIADGGVMRESAIRSTLSSLIQLADGDHAVLAVRHLTKNGRGKAIHRGSGSNAILALARSGLVVAPDPQVDGARVIAQTKSNYGPPACSLRYRRNRGAIEWMDWSPLSAEELLSAPHSRAPRLEQAMAFLRLFLAKGPAPANTVVEEAIKGGIKKDTLKRARAELNVISRRVGGTAGSGHWVWQLAPADH